MSLGSSHFSHVSNQPRSLFQSRIFWMMSPSWLSLLSIFSLLGPPLHSSKHTSHCSASSSCRRPLRCPSCQEDEECDALTFQEQNVPSKCVSEIRQHMQGLRALMPSQTETANPGLCSGGYSFRKVVRFSAGAGGGTGGAGGSAGSCHRTG